MFVIAGKNRYKSPPNKKTDVQIQTDVSQREN